MGKDTRQRIGAKLLAGAAVQLMLATPAWPAPGDAAAGDPARGHPERGDPAFGEYLSSECVTCHQLSGAATAGVPAITGMPPEAFIAALMAYKTGIRDNQVMRSIASRLSEEEMAALAAYFAARNMP